MNNEQWHISKSLSIGHLATTLSVAVVAVFYLTNISHETNINKIRIQNNDRKIHDLNKSINEKVDRINIKLDRIIDKLIEGK